jgi:hypothetical protein
MTMTFFLLLLQSLMLTMIILFTPCLTTLFPPSLSRNQWWLQYQQHRRTTQHMGQHHLLLPMSVLPIPPPSCSTRSSTCPKCFPHHLDNYHLFTTVAEEKQHPTNHPYYTVGGTTVDLVIHDKLHMAHLSHYVMVHTATSLAFSRQGLPTKKQYGLKAGFKKFGSRADAVWYVDASHQLHNNCKGHMGSILTFGHGATTSSSLK